LLIFSLFFDFEITAIPLQQSKIYAIHTIESHDDIKGHGSK